MILPQGMASPDDPVFTEAAKTIFGPLADEFRAFVRDRDARWADERAEVQRLLNENVGRQLKLLDEIDRLRAMLCRDSASSLEKE